MSPLRRVSISPCLRVVLPPASPLAPPASYSLPPDPRPPWRAVAPTASEERRRLPSAPCPMLIFLPSPPLLLYHSGPDTKIGNAPLQREDDSHGRGRREHERTFEPHLDNACFSRGIQPCSPQFIPPGKKKPDGRYCADPAGECRPERGSATLSSLRLQPQVPESRRRMGMEVCLPG
jgi:hypothetical protein